MASHLQARRGRDDPQCTYHMDYADQSMIHPHPSATPEPSQELAERRTGMSFQRTRMSADRTLMSVMRTALSLITFGFTIRRVAARRVLKPKIAPLPMPGQRWDELVSMQTVFPDTAQAERVRG